MTKIRTTEEINALVDEAVKIDEAIVRDLSYPSSGEGVIARCQRRQQLVSTLIEEENSLDYTSTFLQKWDEFIAEVKEVNSDIKRLRVLADPIFNGSGIRTASPFEEIGLAPLYENFINEGAILTQEEREESINIKEDSLNKYRGLISQFKFDFE